ncbi:MAG: hypothetical protein UU87_C0002G0037 [Parcubacteria group bacterium GW2011_GWA2_42_11]|nr:MAG: hypothetical protein UU87_C0002G0037 [Parcubacteria group bacterium GW2011_GWA2_42_11]KKT76766.1 MAG: hypothetical protein UW72_C0001G0007 [Parcubacteria group bacterium GW2011_GWF2_44_7]
MPKRREKKGPYHLDTILAGLGQEIKKVLLFNIRQATHDGHHYTVDCRNGFTRRAKNRAKKHQSH